jgi:hypothetical protein
MPPRVLSWTANPFVRHAQLAFSTAAPCRGPEWQAVGAEKNARLYPDTSRAALDRCAPARNLTSKRPKFVGAVIQRHQYSRPNALAALR